MRTVTAAEQAVLKSPGYATWLRVLIEDAGAVWRDLSAIEANDHITSVNIIEGIDEPWVARVTVKREVQLFSLAPLVTTSKLNQVGGSYSPLLQARRRVRIESATVPTGAAKPADGSSDWKRIFEGRLDLIEWASDQVSITCLGIDGELRQRFIESEVQYGSGPGTAAETVIGQLLANNGALTTLYTPVSPGFLILTYNQKKEHLWDALQAFPPLFGWWMGPRWDNGTSSWRLTLLDPDRAKTAIDWTWYPDTKDATGANVGHYIGDGITELSIDPADIRNAGAVVYSDPADLDAAGVPKRKTVTYEAPGDSITKYGRRFMEMAEAATSPIDTAAEANALVTAFVTDLAEPLASWGLVVPHSWFVQLNDLHRIIGNKVHATADQDVAVVRIEHDFQQDQEPVTRLSLRGKPVAAHDAWLAMEARNGLAGTAPFAAPPAPSGLSVTETVGGVEIAFDKGNQGWVEFDLHLGATAGFTPDQNTYVKTEQTNKFALPSLAVGTVQYAKIVARDAYGNLSAASSAAAVSPGHIPQAMGQYDGVTIRQVAKGHYSGTVRNESYVQFDDVYQHPPIVILHDGGTTDEPGAFWGNAWDGVKYGTSARPAGRISIEKYAYDVTAADFRTRVRFRSKSGLAAWARNANEDNTGAGDPNNNVLNAVGEWAAASLASAPNGAAGDAYTLNFKVAVQTDDAGNVGDPGPPIIQPYILTASAVIAIDSSDNGGTTWTERASYTYNASARATSAGNTWAAEAKTVNVAGLTSAAPADKLRIRIKSFTFNGVAGSVSAHLFSTAATPADSVAGLTYSTSTDVYATKTPDADDLIPFDAFEVS